MKKNIAVVYGGYSSEYEISVGSGENIVSIIDKQKYNIYSILMKKDSWLCIDTNTEINKQDFSLIHDNGKVVFSAVVILIHGHPGENGILQAYFDLINIPYTTCNVLSSSLTFNKYYCNNFLRNFDFSIAKSYFITKGEKIFPQEIEKKLALPMFVKPNAGGSSFGITKVKKISEIQPAIEKAFAESHQVIIEEFVEGIEITCAVVKLNNEIKTFPLCEIVCKNEFFDYEAKYNSELNEEIVPARISNELTEKCENISKKIYKLLDCSGIVRIDYILKNNIFNFLEVNTVPGMTAESLVPKMIKYGKINITDLYSDLIEECIVK